MKDEPRKATIRTMADTDCYTLDRHNFVTLLGPLRDILDQNIGMSVLKSVQLLKSLSARQLETVSKAIDRQTFRDGQVIISEGDDAQTFYMIASGEVEVTKGQNILATLCTGQYFGEMALLSNDRRNATVTAKGEVVCLTLVSVQDGVFTCFVT